MPSRLRVFVFVLLTSVIHSGPLSEFTKDWSFRNLPLWDENINVLCASSPRNVILCNDTATSDGIVITALQLGNVNPSNPCHSSTPLNFSLLPRTLTHLSLNDNAFTGTIGVSMLPRSLLALRLQNNQFSGSL
eukprot:PhF_6_TR2533/c0_g1_i1/m.4301